MKKFFLFVLLPFLLMTFGFYMGWRFSDGHYKLLYMTNVMGYETHKASTYASLFATNEDERAKQFIMNEIKLNLIRADIYYDKLPSSMRAELCEQLLKIVSDKDLLLDFEESVINEERDLLTFLQVI